MHSIHESSPIRGEDTISQQLISFLSWLKRRVSHNRYETLKRVISQAKRHIYNPVQLRGLTDEQVIKLGILISVLDIIKPEVSL
jgi:hypothetical protein